MDIAKPNIWASAGQWAVQRNGSWTADLRVQT